MKSTRRELFQATVASLGGIAAAPPAGDDGKSSVDAPKQKLTTPAGRLTCRVTRGSFDEQDAPALAMALDDLRTYWERAFGPGRFLLEVEGPQQKADLELLIGSAENLPRIGALVMEGKLEAVQPPEQGFILDILEAEGKRTAVLQAADRLGLQYSVYAFAEQFLGVRFVHPMNDVQPDKPPNPARLHIVESPSRSLRVQFETSHTRSGLRGTLNKAAHYSDVGAWRWEDWAGYPESMRHFVAWGVKNRANTVLFDDTGYDETKYSKPFVISDVLWQYMDTRGLKTLAWCSTAYVWCAEAQAKYGKDGLCNHNAPRVGFWDKHPCIGKPAFWQDLDEWLDVLAPHAKRLAGIFTNWQENVCGEGAIEGAEDGVIHRLCHLPYDFNSTRYRKPVLSKGGGCTTCGHMYNVDKWVKVNDYLKDPQRMAARGLPPAGITRTHWGIADPDDGLVAERVVPHLPDGSVSLVSCLPSCNRAERVEAWPRIMDEVNRSDRGSRRVILHRELFYGCGSDMPIVPFTGLDRIDDDMRVFGKYKSTATTFGGVYVFHSLGWLFTLYSMRKQWQTGQDWKTWFRTFFRGLLGAEFIDVFLDIAATLQDVELLEGLEPGEASSGYYCYWGLNFSKLAPDTLPPEGDLRAVGRWWDGSWPSGKMRLVRVGAVDREGNYTSERCASALRRLASLRSKIEHVFEQLRILKKNLPAGEDSEIWEDLVLQPLRVTERFLQCRILLSQSYLVYIRTRERVLAGLDAVADAAEGEARCWQALEAQDEYVRLRPGFNLLDYPEEIKPDTLRNLVALWAKLGREPHLCRETDICQFLDRAERETEV